jgi:hypothetical protein
MPVAIIITFSKLFEFITHEHMPQGNLDFFSAWFYQNQINYCKSLFSTLLRPLCELKDNLISPSLISIVFVFSLALHAFKYG